jgi:hypothetical protein
MTEKELARFALVLKECERIRAMIAEDAASANDASDGIPIAAAPAEEQVPTIIAAA